MMLPIARRAAAWLVWWVPLMLFWVILDKSIESDELPAGAGAAALGAFPAELAFYQAAARFRMRTEWTVSALRRPAQVVRGSTSTARGLPSRPVLQPSAP